MLFTQFYYPPYELREFKNFTLWKFFPGPAAKPAKVPCSLQGRKHSISNPSNLSTFEEIREFFHNHDKKEEYGFGFVLSGTDFFFIDIDNVAFLENVDLKKCHTFDQLKSCLRDYPELFRILRTFSNAYVEKSVSGKGLHILGRGSIPRVNGLKPRYRGRYTLGTDSEAMSFECYDSSTLRYMALTGDILCDMFASIAKDYDFTPAIVDLYKRYFFTKAEAVTYSKETQFITHDSKVHSVVPDKIYSAAVDNKQFTGIEIEKVYQEVLSCIAIKSVNEFRYHELQVLEKEPSPSEADWQFLIFVIKFCPPDFKGHNQLLRRFLRERIRRPKLQIESYCKKTVSKVIISASAKNLIGVFRPKNKPQSPASDQTFPLTDNSRPEPITTTDFVKINTLMSDLFSLHQKKKQQLQKLHLNAGDTNFLTIYLSEQLSYDDLRTFLAVLMAFNQSNKVQQQASSNSTQTSEQYSLSISVSLLVEYMKKSASTTLRRKIIKSLMRLSRVNIEYEVYLKKGKQQKICGSSNLLNFEALLDAKLNTGSVRIVTSPFIWKTLRESYCNYSLINTDIFYSLSSSIEGLLYYYICMKVRPGNQEWTHFSINELVEQLVDIEVSSTYRGWKSRVRKSLIKLSSSPLVMSEMQLELNLETVNHSKVISGIKVRRKTRYIRDVRTTKLLSSE